MVIFCKAANINMLKYPVICSQLLTKYINLKILIQMQFYFDFQNRDWKQRRKLIHIDILG